jgi:ribosomal protein S27E
MDDDSQVRCKICDKNFSISYGGENDIMRHAAGPIPKMNVIWKNTNKL